ncbi:hypothetical protein [Priestia koreensis]|uniref:hypothetical protein n=1 Tax=Priestia koreensis TaxID=284581 RepID=UPI001F568424|nr:hypothetical protein [Priestia koreensis]MCM3004917.1 hypothetical protein [Priestia koreensis]UNL85709.1 hypothetical protein IE339_04115 [Priestia koreensis]
MRNPFANQDSLRKYVASLKTELEFYKEKYAEYQRTEIAQEDWKDQVLDLQKKHEEEKEQLLEQIQWLKALVMTTPSVREEEKQTSTPTPAAEVEKPATQAVPARSPKVSEESWFVQANSSERKGDERPRKKQGTFLDFQ